VDEANDGTGQIADLRRNTAGRDIRTEIHYHGPAGRPAGPDEPVRFGLLPPVTHFAGREDLLAQLAAAMPGDGGGPTVQVLWGLGGVGKTSVAARHVADRLAGVDIAAWIRAEQDPAVDLAALADRLVDLPATTTVEDRARRAVDHLATTPRRWLLVFDNAEDAGRVRSFLPGGGTGQVVVTTRSHGLARLGELLAVGEFDTPTSAAYLETRAPDAGDATALAEALGGLPLALAQAGSYCAGGTPFADYLEFLEELPAAEVFASDPEAGHEQTVASTWRPSIDAATRAAPLAASILDVAAYLAPEQIPRELFEPLAERPGTVRGRKEVADAINALHRYSLVIVGADGFTVHRLLQKVVREGHDGDVARRVLDLLDDALPEDSEDPANWPGFERFAGHGAATLHTLPALDRADRERHVRLLNRLLRYTHVGTAPRPALALSSVIVAYAVEHLGRDHTDTLRSREIEAQSYAANGRTAEALARQVAVCRDRLRVDGDDHTRSLTSRFNLAQLNNDAGHTADAIAQFEAVIADRERLQGTDHRSTVGARHALATCYRSAGRLDEAIALFQQTFAHRRQALGPDHPHTLTTRCCLGEAYSAAGRTAEALAMFDVLVDDCVRVLGPDHTTTLRTGHVLAVTHHLTGRSAEARALMADIVERRRRVLGPAHPDTVESADHLQLWTASPASTPRSDRPNGRA
jgi:tetratricopeptide (TPR) repeat protein